MKKTFLFLLVTIIVSSISAQIKIGYKAGMNFSNIKRTVDNDNNVLRSFNTGIFSNFYLSPQCFFDVELLYSVKGYNGIMIPTGTTANRLNYLSLPVLLGWRADKRIEFLLGSEFNYLTKGVQKNKTGKRIITNFYQKYDVGIDAGVRYSLSKKIKLEARYNYGLSKVQRQFFIYDNSGHGYSTSGFNRIFQLDAGFIF
ncbi:MAG: porin family protein [Ginsengibacter sp.]